MQYTDVTIKMFVFIYVFTQFYNAYKINFKEWNNAIHKKYICKVWPQLENDVKKKNNNKKKFSLKVITTNIKYY